MPAMFVDTVATEGKASDVHSLDVWLYKLRVSDVTRGLPYLLMTPLDLLHVLEVEDKPS